MAGSPWLPVARGALSKIIWGRGRSCTEVGGRALFFSFWILSEFLALPVSSWSPAIPSCLGSLWVSLPFSLFSLSLLLSVLPSCDRSCPNAVSGSSSSSLLPWKGGASVGGLAPVRSTSEYEGIVPGVPIVPVVLLARLP